MKLVVTFLALVACSFCEIRPAEASDCLQYEPAVTTLTGKLIRRTFPGPPNYENVSQGDKQETYWLIELATPICVDESKQDPEIDTAKRNISSVQLVLTGDDYKKYRSLMDKKVSATGTLMGEITGHHHTPVLLTVSNLKKLR